MYIMSGIQYLIQNGNDDFSYELVYEKFKRQFVRATL